jgi:hypothetical protein
MRTLLPTRKKVSKNNEYAEKETLTAPQFIEDSSPTDNNCRHERA